MYMDPDATLVGLVHECDLLDPRFFIFLILNDVGVKGCLLIFLYKPVRSEYFLAGLKEGGASREE